MCDMFGEYVTDMRQVQIAVTKQTNQVWARHQTLVMHFYQCNFHSNYSE